MLEAGLWYQQVMVLAWLCDKLMQLGSLDGGKWCMDFYGFEFLFLFLTVGRLWYFQIMVLRSVMWLGLAKFEVAVGSGMQAGSVYVFDRDLARFEIDRHGAGVKFLVGFCYDRLYVQFKVMC